MNGTSESLAKIARPRNRRVFARARLFSKLDEARGTAAIWVNAPPGSGKTTLVSSYLTERKCPGIWYHVDASDSDPATFFWYLRLAARQFAPSDYKRLPVFTSAYQHGLTAFTHSFFDGLYAILPPGFVIVLDDFQAAGDNSALTEILENAMTSLPEHGNIIAISRDPLPDAFCRLLANEQLEMLSWDDLRFTEEEIRQVVQLRRPQLGEDAIREIAVRTEGWVAGIVFGLQAGADSPTALASGGGNNHEVLFGYFASEVFALQDREHQRILMKLSFLPNLTIAMANELAETKDAGLLLEWLHRQNYFINQQLLRSPTYKIHPLFREFLQHRSGLEFSTAKLKRLRSRAARILESGGFDDSAAEMYQLAGNWERAAGLVGRGAISKFSQGRMRSLTAEIERFPTEVLEQSPWLLYWLGMCELFNDPARGHVLFTKALEIFRAEDNIDGQLASWAGAVNSLLAEWSDIRKLDDLIPVGEQLLEGSAAVQNSKLLPFAITAMCFALNLCRPHSPAVRSYMERTHAEILRSEDKTFSLMGANLLLVHYGWQGQIIRAGQLLEAMEPRFRGEHVNSAHEVMLAAATGWYDMIAGHASQCLERSEAGLNKALSSGTRLFDQRFVGMIAHSHLLLGNVAEAREHLREYTDLAPSKANLLHFHLNYLKAWGSWLHGDISEAREELRMAERFLQTAGSTPIVEAKKDIAQAILCIDQDEFAESRMFLDNAMRIANMTDSAWLQYHCLLVSAYSAHLIGDKHRCRDCLSDALLLARQNGLVVTDWWHGEHMSRLMEIALAHGIEPDYVRHIISQTGLRPGPLSVTSGAWPWPVAIRMLGNFELRIDGQPVSHQIRNQKKVMALLKLLALSGERGLSAGRLADSLWPDAEGDDGRNTLKTTLHRLRKVLGDSDCILLRDGVLTLNPELCWSDVEAFKALARALRAEGSRPAGIKQAMRLYDGPLLPGEDSDWILAAREELQQSQHELVMELGARYEERNRYNKAIRVYRQGIKFDPLDEELCQHLMTCYQRSGRESDAVSVYERLRDDLQRYRARQPSAKTQSLAESILSAH